MPASARVALGDSQAADEYFRRALGVSPGNATAAYQLALARLSRRASRRRARWMRPVMQQGGAARPKRCCLGLCVERKIGDRQAELSYTSQLRNRFPESDEAKAINAGACL